MKEALRKGCVSDIIYLALYYYKNRQYDELLRYLKLAQKRLCRPYVVHYRDTDEEKYTRAMAGVSLSDRIKKCCICDLLPVLHNEHVYIDELVPELIANKADGNACFPPLLMLNTLFVLNHHRLGDTVRSQQSIQDLHTLLLDDDGTNVQKEYKDISWQILGICQQTCGDYVGSLKSFECSLQQTSRCHAIQKATFLRILINVFQHNRF